MLLWIFAVIPIVIILVFFVYFNRFATLGNRIESSLSQIDVQLKRRADLIPNLIEIVKGYVKHEKSIIKEVTDARKALVGAEGLEDRIKANNKLQSALKTIFAIAENYPNLKADTNFLELQRELSDTEDKIQAARRFYNTNVRDLNIKIESFPANTIAGSFGFKQMELFQTANEAEREPVGVKF